MPMAFPAITSRARRVGGQAKGVQKDIDTFPWRQLSEKQHDRTVSEAMLPAEYLASGNIREFSEIEWVRNDGHAMAWDAGFHELTKFGFARRKYTVCALDHMPAAGCIEQAFEQDTTLDQWSRTVRRQHVRHAGAPKLASRDRTWKIAARVQVCHVERPGGVTQKTDQAPWRKGLTVIGQSIRDVTKDPDIQVAGACGDTGWIQTGLRIACVRGANGDVVSTACEAARHCSRDPWDATVSPGVFEIGDDVQNPEQRHEAAGAV